MAQKDIVGGLFGMTPESYYENQNLLNLAEQQRAARTSAGPGTMLNPSLAPFYAQAAQRGQLQGGAIKAIGSLLGVEDPELAKIRDVQSMSGQFDVSTPAGLRSFAQALSAKGYNDLAMQASGEADKRELTQAQTVRALREPNAGIAQLISKSTPESVAKYQQTGNVGDLQLAKGANGEGDGVGQAGPVGKSGAYRDADGIVYSASEMAKQRAGFQGLEKLADNLNNITEEDIKNSESIIDYTQGETRKALGGTFSKKTLAAQAKINASQLLKQIEALPPGSASNADMIAAKSSFPGYGDADNLTTWVADTKKLLAASLKRQSEQYGFKQRVIPTGVADTSNNATGNNTNQQAMDWLKANPNHPQAAAVRKKLGI